jgi:heme-degrading monooxygenase HmoA
VIVEIAQIDILGGREADFEAAFMQAIGFAAGSPGYLGHELRRSLEHRSRYLLRIEWTTLEAHTVTFRGSAAFSQWRAAVGPFFASAPVVEHFEPVAGEEA